MNRALVAALSSLTGFALSSCTTDACACTPPIVPALVMGSVVDVPGAPVPGAQVRAVSVPAANCHSLDADFGFVTTHQDGSFDLALASGALQDSVCVLVFARPPPATPALGTSDTTVLIMDFRGE